MSLLRVSLVAVQAIGNQLACTPPNPTQSQQRYQTEDSEPYILQLAPLVFKVLIVVPVYYLAAHSIYRFINFSYGCLPSAKPYSI